MGEWWGGAGWDAEWLGEAWALRVAGGNTWTRAEGLCERGSAWVHVFLGRVGEGKG